MDDGPEIEELERHPPSGAAEAEPTPSRHAEGARIGGSPTTILRTAGLVAILMCLAVAKPWGASGNEPPDREAADGLPGLAPHAAASVAGPASAAPIATPEPTQPPGAVDCGSPDGWRLVTAGWLAGQPAEAHAVVEPVVSASGPADPRIGSLPAGQAPLTGVGACRPASSLGDVSGSGILPPIRIAGAWRLDGTEPVPMAVTPKGPAASAAVTQLYGPVGAAFGDWQAGRYVVELIASDLPDPAWVGFDLTLPPTPPAQPQP